jgi:hypothetical protein
MFCRPINYFILLSIRTLRWQYTYIMRYISVAQVYRGIYDRDDRVPGPLSCVYACARAVYRVVHIIIIIII